MTANTPCQPDELRTLFLFEALTDEQLGDVVHQRANQAIPAGPDLRRG